MFQYQVDNITVELSPKGPVFLYTFVPYEKVQAIYIENQTNPSRFAAALEPLVYIDEPWEMQIPINQRVNSRARVEFIKNCVFRHFNVLPQLQETVWKSIRNDLDRKARRTRTSARSTPTSAFRTSPKNLLDILSGGDSDS
ncbi:hypothetical protein OESDEN_21101 [Oesophagostomum dentatum]|uniref:Uncharacterized protein n=1 Tax=Oesophagostomum dentatum TaxID=61180 RepID=A0A0B1S5U9_OESDE|nr:hypothetical protein OESDEN_21101 [Oesophagostomum dentatum]